MTDLELYNDYKQTGNIESRNKVIENNQGIIYKLVFKRVRDPFLQEEIVSSVALLTIKCFDKYDPERGAFTTFLTQVTRTAIQRFFKKPKKKIHSVPFSDLLSKSESKPEDYFSVEKEPELENNELLELAIIKLNSIKPVIAECVKRRLGLNCKQQNYKEIAKSMRFSYQTAANYYNKGIELIQQGVQEMKDEYKEIAKENGAKIANYRKQAGKSLDQFSQEIEVSKSTITDWEKGHTYPPACATEPHKERYEKVVAMASGYEGILSVLWQIEKRLEIIESKLDEKEKNDLQAVLEKAVEKINKK